LEVGNNLKHLGVVLDNKLSRKLHIVPKQRNKCPKPMG